LSALKWCFSCQLFCLISHTRICRRLNYEYCARASKSAPFFFLVELASRDLSGFGGCVWLPIFRRPRGPFFEQ
jgi:hypothetical protein